MTKLNYLKAVVFDWAGTTVDFGSRAPVVAVQQIFRQRGIEITLAQAREPMGRAKRDHLFTVSQMPTVAATWQAEYGCECSDADIDAMYADFLPLQEGVIRDYSAVMEGIVPAVNSLRNLGLKIGSTTGYTRHLMSIVAAIAKQQGYAPDCVLCAEDTPRGRPAPYLLYAAAMQLDVYPLASMVNVDDTTVGIEAGRNAGCWTIGISRTGSCVGLSEEELQALSADEVKTLCDAAARQLQAAGAHYVIESVADIVPTILAIEARMAYGERPD